MARKEKRCGRYGCPSNPHLAGLCKEHYDEQVEKERRREGALTALHRGLIAERLPENPNLREELFRLRDWWFRICHAVNYDRKDTLLGDEAQYAVEWCISLAQEIVDAEIAFRAGSMPSPSIQGTREWVWDRFRNLEAGLRSNGISRSPVEEKTLGNFRALRSTYKK